MQVSTSESRDCLGRQSTKCKRSRTCIKCGKGGKLLVCEKCPIEIHESCMTCPAQLDDLGKFYCPYCLHRETVQECLRAKEKVMLAKRAAISCLLGKEGEQTPRTKLSILKILSLQKRKFDASHKRAKANHDINQPKKLEEQKPARTNHEISQPKKLEEQKQERALQGTRSKSPREGAEGLVINKQRNASALGDNGIQQIQPDYDTVILNEVYLGSRICGKSCVKELTDESVCGVEQEKIAEKDVSNAVEVEETIQLKCSVLDDGYQVKGDAQDKEQVEQLDTLFEEGPTSSEPVVRGSMTTNHDFVKNSGQSSWTKDKEQHIAHTPAESQGSSGYPVTTGRITEICGKPGNLPEDSLTPIIGKRPLGRKASKEKVSAKRQKSQDAHSSIGDRIVKSIDDLHASSAVEWERSNLLNVKKLQMGIRYERLEMIRLRIAIERELMAIDKLLYNEEPSLIGSPNEAKKRLAIREAKIEQLTAQAHAILSDNVEEHVTTKTCRNLNHSFDDEADNRS
ncbi:hypothetical protein Drorol1_Dr00019489 [Drosera rotundifolia]